MTECLPSLVYRNQDDADLGETVLGRTDDRVLLYSITLNQASCESRLQTTVQDLELELGNRHRLH